MELESAYRKPIIGGNLKREFKHGQTRKLIFEIAEELQNNPVDPDKVDVFIAPSEVYLSEAARAISELEAEGKLPKGFIKLGAQNVARRDKLGAFSGQHATATQLKEMKVSHVIIGHSEVRHGSNEDTEDMRFQESNKVINAKVRAAIAAGLTPVLAFGEDAQERASGREFSLVRRQITESLSGISKEEMLSSGLVLAYEPVWAIGAQALRAASKEEADSMQRFVRSIILELFGPEVAQTIRIQYGGSVKADNAASLIAQASIDGGLIGGAAKKAETFLPIVHAFAAMQKVPAPLTGRSLYDALKASGLGKIVARGNKEFRDHDFGKSAVTMCTNIRTPLSLDGIMQAAKETNSVAILQQAISEFDYTWPNGYSPDNVYRFAEEAHQAAARNNFSDYILKADHVTVKVDKAFLKDQGAQDQLATLLETILTATTNTEREAIFAAAYENKDFMANDNIKNAMKVLKKAVEHTKATVAAGYTIFALDASFMPARLNILATAFLAGFIPANASIEAEVGEIGNEDNSTVADALEFITGIRYQETIQRDPKTNAIVYSELVKENNQPVVVSRIKGLLDHGITIDRLAINNGTSHGNNYDKEGNPIQTKMNIRMTQAIAEALKPFGIEIVQHGVTGTPLSVLPQLRAAGIASAHVGTHWQNIVWDTLTEKAKEDPTIQALVNRIRTTLVEKYGKNYKVTSLTPSPEEDKVLHAKNLAKLIGKD
ncbi:MAG: triose-phosphate isomerase, partial [Candidatus Omnitrophica bacterium]|nr:triose-phosphate isomerase [Candidatus Omnitrophota bacterium]